MRGDYHDGAQTRHPGHCRGHRNRKSAPFIAVDRLRLWTGLLLFTPDPGHRIRAEIRLSLAVIGRCLFRVFCGIKETILANLTNCGVFLTLLKCDHCF